MKSLAIDLFCGLDGWGEALAEEGFDVVGFDIVDMRKMLAQQRPKGIQLVIQDVRTLHGSQFKDAAVIVASPPCQKYSYMAMPWSKAKRLRDWYRDPEHPERIVELNELFDACFRIQREACEATSRHIPLVVENVRGAQEWVGRSAWNFGSYHLWGDVPTLMPFTFRGIKVPRFTSRDCGAEGLKQGGSWFGKTEACSMSRFSSRSKQRKAASAQIAKIPHALARHIATVYHP